SAWSSSFTKAACQSPSRCHSPAGSNDTRNSEDCLITDPAQGNKEQSAAGTDGLLRLRPARLFHLLIDLKSRRLRAGRSLDHKNGYAGCVGFTPGSLPADR